MPEPRDPVVPGEFAPDAKRAVYDAIELRRDVRNFRPDPLPDAILGRILSAAHRAGSVGLMQPWDFVLLRSPERRAELYELFQQANARAASRFPDERGAKYGALKLQGVLDAPLVICVTCDTRRGGPHVLGRDSIPEMDRYSTCLAIQNLWLAARAEGVGVGWVSIVDNAELAALLRLPEGVVPIACLCVGYPVEFAGAPMLAQSGWRERIPLERLIHSETWSGTPAEDWAALIALLADADPPSRAPERAPASLHELVAGVADPDPAGGRSERVRSRLDALCKPRGSLGRVEDLAIRLAVAQGRDSPTCTSAELVIFGGDHGVAAERISAYAPRVTAQLAYTLIAGGTTANALARSAGCGVRLVDVGIDHDFGDAPGLVARKVRRGTRNLAAEPALTIAEVERAILVGAEVVRELGRVDVLALGEVGIGNTTAAAALVALLTGMPAMGAVGRGTGIGDGAMARKRAVVERVLARTAGCSLAPVQALAEVGGLEMAALVGAMLAAAARRIPVLLDGFITGAAALAAAAICPVLPRYLIASHRSAEPGHGIGLAALGLEPLLELELRLGEGSGALLALPLLRSACAVLRDVRTYREAGIDEPADVEGRA